MYQQLFLAALVATLTLPAIAADTTPIDQFATGLDAAVEPCALIEQKTSLDALAALQQSQTDLRLFGDAEARTNAATAGTRFRQINADGMAKSKACRDHAQTEGMTLYQALARTLHTTTAKAAGKATIAAFLTYAQTGSALDHSAYVRELANLRVEVAGATR